MARLRTATTAWRISPALILQLHARFRSPTDAYLNGSQVWILEHGPREFSLEWRLHPVAKFVAPVEISHHELWDQVVAQLVTGADPSTLQLDAAPRALDSLWDGLECFSAYNEPIEPAELNSMATDALGLAPDAFGLVDHQRIGDAWEQSNGAVSLLDLVLEELRG